MSEIVLGPQSSMDALWAFSTILQKCWVPLIARNKLPELAEQRAEQIYSDGPSRPRERGSEKKKLPY